MSELEDLLGIARRAAEVAREVIMPLYAGGTAVELKADRTPVTVADRNAEVALREFLARECPGHGILGEEFGETPGDGRYRWILDPIDGTKSFIHRVPLFGTLIAHARQADRQQQAARHSHSEIEKTGIRLLEWRGARAAASAASHPL